MQKLWGDGAWNIWKLEWLSTGGLLYKTSFHSRNCYYRNVRALWGLWTDITLCRWQGSVRRRTQHEVHLHLSTCKVLLGAKDVSHSSYPLCICPAWKLTQTSLTSSGKAKQNHKIKIRSSHTNALYQLRPTYHFCPPWPWAELHGFRLQEFPSPSLKAFPQGSQDLVLPSCSIPINSRYKRFLTKKKKFLKNQLNIFII